MRSAPIIGAAAHFFQHDKRMLAARVEDGTYAAIMATLVEPPHLVGASQARERHVSFGQVAGFLVANIIALACIYRGSAWKLVMPATWLAAFALDTALSRAGGAFYDRRAAAAYDRILAQKVREVDPSEIKEDRRRDDPL